MMTNIVGIRAGTVEMKPHYLQLIYLNVYRYAERQGWKVEMMSSNDIGVGGYKESYL